MNVPHTCSFFLFFLPLAVVLSLVLGICYINEQQLLRLAANEPQIWTAKDAALRIENGEASDSVIPQTTVVLENDPAPYMEVFDSSGAPLSGNGRLHGELPTLPVGVFDKAAENGESWLTWQPEADVREAVDIEAIAGNDTTPKPGSPSFVLVGRSLSYTEEQEHELTVRVFLGWFLSLVILAVLYLILAVFTRKNRIP